MVFSVYCLLHSSCGKTYIGYTDNFPRRLKAHNHGIKGGGAKFTSMYTKLYPSGNWGCYILVSGFSSRRAALAFEWAWKRAAPVSMKIIPLADFVERQLVVGDSIQRRMACLYRLLSRAQWTKGVSSLGERLVITCSNILFVQFIKDKFPSIIVQ